jgi:hypothetical protein
MPRRSKRNKTRKQKTYKMIGCAKKCPRCHHIKCTCKNRNIKKGGGMGCGPQGCPIAPYPMKGGNCDVMGCGRILGTYQNGGNCGCATIPVISGGGDIYNSPELVPGPFVGKNWGGLINQWPGVDGVSANRNYLELNTYKTDPQTMMKIRGGRRKTKRNQRGGSFITTDLVNLGRDFTYNLNSAYNALNSISSSPNPLPFKDQLVK